MKLSRDISINGRTHAKGTEVPWKTIYPFFMVHMLMFGGSGFLMAYGTNRPPLSFMYAHGGIAITVYTVFYLAIFGLDEVKWMFINAGLGLLGIYTQIGWILSLFGKKIGDYPLSVHVTPFLYFVLYTFLLRQALLDMTGARGDEQKQRLVDNVYVALSVTACVLSFCLERFV